MHLEILVEEPSAEEALKGLLPKIIAKSATWVIHVFGGKSDLLGNLVSRLRGYADWIPDDYRIVVLIDGDDDDCKVLKMDLQEKTGLANLSVWSAKKPSAGGKVVHRLAIEELEAWFFGDVPALRAAFSKVPETLEKKKGYRDPDAIAGGTWEALERVLQKAGHYRTGLQKMDAARRITQHMDPDRNRSRSFQHFRDALRKLVAQQ